MPIKARPTKLHSFDRHAVAWACVACTVASLAIVLWISVPYLRDNAAIERASSLRHQYDFRRTVNTLLEGAVSSRSTSSQCIVELENVMVRLRDDDVALIVDGYYPYAYTQRDLLSELYWKIARFARERGETRQKELLSVLWKSRPKSEDDVMRKGFESKVRHFGFEVSSDRLVPVGGDH